MSESNGTETTATPTTETKVPSALERLEGLERAMHSVLSAMNLLQNLSDQTKQTQNGLRNLQTNIQQLDKIVEATSDLSFKKEIFSQKELETQIQNNASDRLLKIENSLISQGLVEDSEEINANSLLVLSQSDAEGNLLAIRDHVDLSKWTEGAIALFVGKKSGESFSPDNGKTTINILRVLNPVIKGSKTEMPTTEATETQTETQTAGE